MISSHTSIALLCKCIQWGAMEVSPDKKREDREVVAITRVALVAMVSVVSVVSRTVPAMGTRISGETRHCQIGGYKTMDTKHYI